jgi:hypothetical protein
MWVEKIKNTKQQQPNIPATVDESNANDGLIAIECIEQHINDDVNCRDEVKKLVNFDKKEEGLDEASKELITVIEYLLQAGIFAQIFLTIYTIFLNKFEFIDRYVFHISDWAINTPPILGVLANLVSFSSLLSRGVGIQSIFSDYFFQAVITTLIGGLFYMINLALKIVIHPRIDSA